MTRPKRRLLLFAFVLASGAGVALIVWQVSWSSALRYVQDRAESDLTQTSERLIAQLQSYRELAVLLADHPEVEALLQPNAENRVTVRAAAESLLQETSDKTGALRIVAFGTNGVSMARSDLAPRGPLPELWTNAATRALQGALGRYTGVDVLTGRRSFGFAAPVFSSEESPPTGGLLVAIDLEAIEAEWRADTAAVFFRDEDGRMMISNRSELLRRESEPVFPALDVRYRWGHELWHLPDPGPYVPADTLHLSRDLPQIGMSADVLVGTGPAKRLALSQTGFAALAWISLGTAGLWLLGRRDAFRDRLRTEAKAKEELEARVEERTRALSMMNAALRYEVAERKEAELRLKAAQDRLVQAGKLSALGEMSAGISHELNQPLMAIQSFSENAQLLLEKGRSDVVAQNLVRISELGHRMGRIIKNLRAFARQENAPVRPTDPARVIEAVLELAATRLRETQVAVEWVPPVSPMLVMAGEVRLQQVIMNLVTNALDAMAGLEVACLSITVESVEENVRIVVADSGPGIANPDRIFDPFYTTKEVGPSDGMGLGLSISYGLVQSFGGGIEGCNRPSGGAMFTVTLPKVVEERAA